VTSSSAFLTPSLSLSLSLLSLSLIHLLQHFQLMSDEAERRHQGVTDETLRETVLSDEAMKRQMVTRQRGDGGEGSSDETLCDESERRQW
jgi:hypothetical protein